jgi:hypothetical protein
VLAFTSVYVFELSLINGLRAKEIRKTDPGEFAHRVVNVGRLARIFAKSSLPNILANVSVFAKKMSGSHSVSCWGGTRNWGRTCGGKRRRHGRVRPDKPGHDCGAQGHSPQDTDSQTYNSQMSGKADARYFRTCEAESEAGRRH